MCRWVESEPSGCFFLGILNGEDMLVSDDGVSLAANSQASRLAGELR